jgi:23S rRNA pseudouridine2605 synthase
MPSGQFRRVGLARALSKLGYCSRSRAEMLIRAGRVQLNGVVKRDPEWPVLFGRDRITLDGSLVRSARKEYWIFNKPRGLLTTASDEKSRPTVYSALKDTSQWLAPVGRLDKASEGLLLFTNDPEWAARITDPESHIPKLYHVQVSGEWNNELSGALVKGFQVADGDFLRGSDVRILRQGHRNTWLAITLHEGKNRHIRRMLEQLGFEILRLVRVSIGPLALGELTKGASRPLTAVEKSAIDALCRTR